MDRMRLEQLCRGVAGAAVPAAAAQLDIRAVRSDSRSVEPGDLFVAVPGEAVDGGDFVREAVRRGAIAVVAEEPVDSLVPVVQVGDARLALAELAAEFHGRPADSLRLAGVTGTLGKTSVLTMLREILDAADIPVGIVGSLGIHYPGHEDATPNTTPGSLPLQEAMAGMVAAGTRVMAMEVTSHALLQGRVHGLMYDLGIFTNLTMLEHMEYHGTFAGYLDAKLKFFRLLKAEAPLVYPCGDRAVAAAARRHPGPMISVGAGGAMVSLRHDDLSLDGTTVTLSVRRPLPRVGGGKIPPMAMSVRLATLGRTNVANAALAASAALSLGADPNSIRTALAAMEPPRRRLQVLHRGGPVVIDDTVGHPDSISGLFEVVQRLRYRRLHVAFSIRGQRGPEINRQDAEALAIWSRAVPIHSLVTTTSVDTADERNEVTPEERDAFLAVAEASGLPHRHEERLEDAIAAVMADAAEQDLILLLGAQGMDAAAAMVMEHLASTAPR
jgi:UDP-N-acetylmuramoyl-L-alanyl-D-glutamate--2,6-diaminopimelate ligase